jgi:hypothetical protein
MMRYKIVLKKTEEAIASFVLVFRDIGCKARQSTRRLRKTCSKCGTVQEFMPLKIREWTCPDCGTEHDRDFNTAKNVLMFATAGSAGIHKTRGAVKTPRAVA